MLYMVGLEPYKERYTTQLDGPNGWWDRNLKKAGVEYTRVQPIPIVPVFEETTVRHGVVLDPVRRSLWGFMQVAELLRLAESGKITDKDVIYFSDFWHPGFEQLPYTFQQLGIKPKMYAYCHAQSVDEFDFTRKMRPWIRHFERGIGKVLDGVFVTCPTLKSLLSIDNLAPEEKVHVVGHVWSTEEVMERMPVLQRSLKQDETFGTYPRKNQVVFSSRWDSEKNPEFFLAVADHVSEKMPEAKFVVTTSAPKIRSNDARLLRMLTEAQIRGWVEVRENQTKEQYYATLCESKVQFNCSDQDWVSYVLLEASAAGCFPIYPKFRSFPETFLGDSGGWFLYEHLNVEAAATKVLEVLNSKVPLWSPRAIEARSWIHRRFDTTWLRILHVMGFYPSTLGGEETKDPFKPGDWL